MLLLGQECPESGTLFPDAMGVTYGAVGERAITASSRVAISDVPGVPSHDPRRIGPVGIPVRSKWDVSWVAVEEAHVTDPGGVAVS